MNDQSQDYGYPSFGDEYRPRTPAGEPGYSPQAGSPFLPSGQPPPTGSTPQWGEPTWGQPTWGSVPPASEWPPSGTPQDHGYPQGEDTAQGYPLSQYTEWANVEVPPAPPVRGPEPSNRGTVALALSLAALGISLLLSVWCAQTWVTADQLTGGRFDVAEPTPATQSYADDVVFSMVGQLAPSILGLIGLIVGLTALGTTSRGAGIAAVIVAVLAPLVSFLTFMVILASGIT